jgi:hypothetical protein
VSNDVATRPLIRDSNFKTLIDKVIIHMLLIIFFGVNPLIQRGKSPNNLQFSREVSKLWLKVVRTRNQTWVLLNDSF